MLLHYQLEFRSEKNGLSSKKNIKKVGFWRTTYLKSAYLCIVLIKQLIVLRFKSKENEKISFDGRSYRSSIFRILW